MNAVLLCFRCHQPIRLRVIGRHRIMQLGQYEGRWFHLDPAACQEDKQNG